MSLNNDSSKGMLTIFLALTNKLLSNEDAKRNQRVNLSKKIASTTINKQQFLPHLKLSSNFTIQHHLQTQSNHFKICQRCIDLLQHKDHEIHLFGKLLLDKIITNNNTDDQLKDLMINVIFRSYSNIIPKSLVESPMKIATKLKTITIIIDTLNDINNHKYSKQMKLLNKSFMKLYDTLCPDQKFDAVPYKLPSIEIQTILIKFWSKHPKYIPDDISFRTMYLLRWICVLPSDFDEKIMKKLINIMTEKFSNNDASHNSESVLMLFGMFAFLGGSTVSIQDDMKPSNLLYKVLEQIPFSAMDYLNKNFEQILKTLPNETVRLIIWRMLEFPFNDKVNKWKQCFYYNLDKYNYFKTYRNYTNNRYIINNGVNNLSLVNKPGLTNINWVTCYMNSIIQILSISDQFRESLLSLKSLQYDSDKNKQKNICKVYKNDWIKMNFIMNELQNILCKLKLSKKKRTTVSTRKFVNLLPLPWSSRQQQDGHQFIKYILDLLWETIKHSNCSTLNDYMKTDYDPFFGGLQCGYTKCCKCGNVTKKYDKFNEIPLSMSSDFNGVNKLIDGYFQTEKLTKDNKYKCEKCKEYVEAIRYFEIMEAPKTLMLCLKRMEWKLYNNQIKSIKNCKFINCPLTLNLKDAKYLLYGTVIHSGNSSEFGHYYTIGRHTNDAMEAYDEKNDIDNGEWFKFDDQNVTKSSYQKLYKSNKHYSSNDVPYLLFYKRINNKNIIQNDIEQKQNETVQQEVVDGDKIKVES